MNKIMVVSVALLMLTSPLFFYWSANRKDEGFSYNIHISPLFYESETKNTYGYANETKLNPINLLSPRDLYTTNSISSLDLWALGWVYFFISLGSFIGFMASAIRGNRRGMNLMFIIYVAGFIIYMYGLITVLNEAGLKLIGISRGFVCSPEIGMFVPIIGGIIYEIERIVDF